MSLEDFLKDAEKEAESLPIDEREERLSRIRAMWENYRGDDEVVSFEELEALMENEPPVKKILSGIQGLDDLMGGFRYEQLVVLSAQEKTGKTTFALQLADLLKEEKPVCFLFEQSARELIRQMKDRGQPRPEAFTPKQNTDNKWEWIEQRIFESMVKRGSRVFVIDNVDWLEKEYGYNQRTDEVMRDLLMKLKNFCKQWGVIIILIAHIRKIPFQQIPQPDDIKDTAAFKQIADVVLILWRKTTEAKVEGTKTKAPVRGNETLLWVAENRQTGRVGYVQLAFDGISFSEKVWDVGLQANEDFNSYEPTF